MKTLLQCNQEVRTARNEGGPVVALESTIITHGMPYPTNLETAREVEAIVREHGATPATIAILDGAVKVGLSDAELATLADRGDVMKLSRADLGIAVARGVCGSTTVAATMIIARLAGIDVFATGGIGGVHRGAELSFDVSADLSELGRTAVTVVCAGAKAILDLPKTLEVLETLGVPVIAMGQQSLPAFWSRDSGLSAPLSMDSNDALVDFLLAREQLGLVGGVLVCQSVPASQEIPRAEIDIFIERALAAARSAGVSGKEVTPWLLAHVAEATEGRSLATNRALILNNAASAARLAVRLQASRSP